MTTSWRESKDAGRQAFLDSNYPQALFHYSEAIDKLLLSSASSSSPASAAEERLRVDQHGRSGSTAGSSRVGLQQQHHPFQHEHQILLSNVIACRLKIGGTDMAEKAVEEAKQCIALNDKWSKAHVRLASAYIALGNHSNDACLSLQRAISLDRNNKVARSMLVREMRERNSRERCGGSGGREGNVATNGSSHHSREHNEENSNHPSSTTAPSAPQNQQQQQQQQQHDDELDVDDIDEADDTPSSSRHLHLQTIISQRIQQLISWYHSQSDDLQTLILVSILFVILYVALGGRFGFESSLLGNSRSRIGGGGGGGRTTRGNYGQGNAYERYSTQNRYSSGANNEASDNYGRQHHHHQQQQQQEQQTRASTGFNDRTNPQNDGYYSSSRYEYYDHEPRRGRGYGGGATTSYHMPNLYDGSIVSMAILLLLGFICHKLGLNPFQALWMLNIVQRHAGNGGRFGYGAYRGRGGGGIFMGGGGGGFGFGRGGRFGFGRRGRGGW